MKPRHLVAPAALAALALAPLAVTSAASAAGTHDQTITDSDTTTVTTKAVDIVSTHLSTTTSGYRAVVAYRDLTPSRTTRWAVAFRAAPDLSGATTSGNYISMRINAKGQASTVAYYYTPTNGLIRSTCRSSTTKPDYAKNTITFSIPAGCWKVRTSPAVVVAGAKRYAAADYATATPDDTFNSGESATSDSSNNFFMGGWSWKDLVLLP